MLKKAVATLALSLFGLFGCAHGDLVVGEDHYKLPIPPVVVLHGDVEFTPHERDLVKKATDLWKAQTDGLADIRVVYDLDFNSTSSLQEHLQDNVLIREESWMDNIVKIDCQYAAEKGLPCPPVPPQSNKLEGYVNPGGGIHNPEHDPVHVVFVADRMIQTDALWVYVTLHEFGHLLGLPHIATPQAIMYPTVIPTRSQICLAKPDLESFCQVNDCKGHVMKPCE